ncbi:RICIN domain-containing protein [Streptomyces sp. NPDC002992]|uniref:RICIN domain-containing protein n=1 Tax=Streptomyces sp. NPDC002992 TaxID=3154273 RepID=UPI0033A3B717
MKANIFKHKVLALGAASVVLAGASVLANAETASASGYTWVSYSDGSCMDTTGAGTPSAGTAVISWPCRSGSATQGWYSASDDYGRRTIRHANTGLCLDISGASTANGAALILWHCNSAWNQVWEARSPGSGWGGCVNLINPTTGRAVDKPGGYGVQLAAYNSWHGANQVWC